MILHEMQKCCGWVAVTLFSSIFILGDIGKLCKKPLNSKVFVNLLNARAQIGLTAAAFAFLHVILLISEFDSNSFHKYYYKDEEGNNTYDMQWWAQLLILFGALAGLFTLPMVISSFTGQWSRKEWMVMQPVCGFLVLVFAGCHVAILGNKPYKLAKGKGWPGIFINGKLPGITFFAGIACYSAILLRIVTLTAGRFCGWVEKRGGLQGYMKVADKEEQQKL